MGARLDDERLAMRNARLYLAGLATSLLGSSAMSLALTARAVGPEDRR